MIDQLKLLNGNLEEMVKGTSDHVKACLLFDKARYEHEFDDFSLTPFECCKIKLLFTQTSQAQVFLCLNVEERYQFIEEQQKFWVAEARDNQS